MAEKKQGKESQPTVLKVGKNIKNRRVDKYVQKRCPDYSRQIIQNLIKKEKISINDQVVSKQSQKVSPGDIVKVYLPELPSKEITPEKIPLDIIYEDDDIIVINKQADMIVHPARSINTGTLVHGLAYHAENLSSGLGECRPGIVHRLDKNTTGVMVVTKNDEAQGNVAMQFQERKVKKAYLAIVHGCPDLDADRIKQPIGTHPRKRELCTVRKDGKEAISIFEVLERFRGFSLLKIRILTGRTHQIRVHLQHIKHPIVADDMYGGKLVYPWQLKDEEQKVEEPIIDRPCLHAYSLEFKHPSTDQQVKFEAPLPEDMQNLLEMLRKYRKE